jgi:hypothetical protein
LDGPTRAAADPRRGRAGAGNGPSFAKQAPFKNPKGELPRRASFGRSLRWYDLQYKNQYNKPGPAQPSRQVKPDPLGGYLKTKNNLVVARQGGKSMIRQYRKDAFIIFILLAFVYAYFYQDAGSNGNSRFDLIFAAVQEGHLYIDTYHEQEDDQTIDQAYFDGHYYSDKAIGPSVVGTIFYIPMSWMQHFIHLPNQRTVKMILTFLVIGIPSAAAGSFLYILSMYWSQSRLKAFLVTAAVSLGTMYFPYSVVFFSHQFTSSLLFCAFFMIYLIKEKPERMRNGYVFLIGSLLGWALISEYPAAVIILALIGYYFSVIGRPSIRRLLSLLILPMLGGLIPIFLQLVYNRLCFGNFLSIGYENLANPYFNSAMQQGLMGIHRPNLHALFYMTFHPTLGLFWESPVLLLSILGAVLLLRNRLYRNEAILAVWVICSYIVILSGYYMWWGGYALGARHIIPILPFFCILLSFVPKRLNWLFAGLCAVSVCQMMIAAASTVQIPDTMVLQIRTLGFFDYSNIYSYCWKQLMEGDFTENLGHLLLTLKSWSSLIPLLVGMTGITIFFFWYGRNTHHLRDRISAVSIFRANPKEKKM